MTEVFWIIRKVLEVYVWIIIGQVVLSWLVGFGTMNYNNPQVRMLWKGLNAVTEPVLGPLRRVLPSAGGLDFSPLVVILAINVALGFLPR